MPPRPFRSLVVGVLALLALLPAAASAAEPGVTPLGYTSGRAVDEAPAIADALGGAPAGHRWVRLFADWAKTERAGDDVYDTASLAEMDQRFRRLKATGANLIVTVQDQAAWAPSVNTDAGAAKYADFMAYMAHRYRGVVAVWELWNEPDDSIFWPSGPNAPAYAGLLERAYAAIKAADSSATVITGGFVGSDFGFLEKLYANGAGGAFDGVAVHTDTACRIDAPGVVYREADGRIGRFAFTGYREVHAVMAAHGDAAKGIWLTEMGWTAAADLPCTEGANAGKRSQGVSPADQARFLKQAFACLAADPYVKVASWFTLQDHVETNRFGFYDVTGAARPALAAMKAVGDGTGTGVDAGCGAKADHDAPTVTISAPALYFQRFAATGAATDPTTPIRRIELWADGKRIMGQEGSRFAYDWWGSSKIAFGAHTIQLRAYDEGGNVGIASTRVVRGNPRTAPRTVRAALGIRVKLRGRRFVVAATVRPPADKSFAEQPHGRLELRFERKAGGRWTRSRIRKGIASGVVRQSYTAAATGTWRVYGALVADAPYKRTTTAVRSFRVR